MNTYLTSIKSLFVLVAMTTANLAIPQACNQTASCDSTNVRPMTGNFVVPLANQERETPVINNNSYTTNVTNVAQYPTTYIQQQIQPIFVYTSPGAYCGAPGGRPDYANACGNQICRGIYNRPTGFLLNFEYSDGSSGTLVCL
jgi:hypothetical protein